MDKLTDSISVHVKSKNLIQLNSLSDHHLFQKSIGLAKWKKPKKLKWIVYLPIFWLDPVTHHWSEMPVNIQINLWRQFLSKEPFQIMDPGIMTYWRQFNSSMGMLYKLSDRETEHINVIRLSTLATNLKIFVKWRHCLKWKKYPENYSITFTLPFWRSRYEFSCLNPFDKHILITIEDNICFRGIGTKLNVSLQP